MTYQENADRHAGGTPPPAEPLAGGVLAIAAIFVLVLALFAFLGHHVLPDGGEAAGGNMQAGTDAAVTSPAPES